MGRVSLNTALLLLPPKVAIPVGIAVRAVARVLDRGIDLGLGRSPTSFGCGGPILDERERHDACSTGRPSGSRADLLRSGGVLGWSEAFLDCIIRSSPSLHLTALGAAFIVKRDGVSVQERVGSWRTLLVPPRQEQYAANVPCGSWVEGFGPSRPPRGPLLRARARPGRAGSWDPASRIAAIPSPATRSVLSGQGLATHHRAPFTDASPLAAAGCLPLSLQGLYPCPCPQ
jgi:hypothetical protein